MSDVREGCIWTLCIVTTLASCAGNSAVKFAPVRADEDAIAALTRVSTEEEVLQSVAHTLVDLQHGVRKGNESAFKAPWAEQVVGAPFPSERGPSQPLSHGVRQTSWVLESEDRQLSGGEMAASLKTFLTRFGSVEDIRFLLGDATIQPDGSVKGVVKFQLIGRDATGRREWVEGLADLVAAKADDEWQIQGFRLNNLSSKVADRDLFSEVAAPAGMTANTFETYPIAQAPRMMRANGSSAVADVNLDGLVDVLLTGSQDNVLYINKGARFETVLGSDDPLRQHPSIASLFFDYDNDGDPDLFLSTWHGAQRLLENRYIPDGIIAFTDVTERLGSYTDTTDTFVNGIATMDVNGDGRPDVHVLTWGASKHFDRPKRIPALEGAPPDLLFVSQPDGSYVESAAEYGLLNSRYSHGQSIADIDGNGTLELYVTNDWSGGNMLHVFDGKRFQDQAEERGLVDGGWGMGASFADYDNDGDLDLHVTRMSSTAGARVIRNLSDDLGMDRDALSPMVDGNKIYTKDGSGRFTEAHSFKAGWSYGGGFVDLDNDGWEDVYAPAGHMTGESWKDT
jgi:hypothetical protein